MADVGNTEQIEKLCCTIVRYQKANQITEQKFFCLQLLLIVINSYQYLLKVIILVVYTKKCD